VAPARSVAEKKRRALPPVRPNERMSGAAAIPVTRLPTTRGKTVIRMALTKSVPTGSSQLAIRASAGEPVTDVTVPIRRPAARPSSTRSASEDMAAKLDVVAPPRETGVAVRRWALRSLVSVPAVAAGRCRGCNDRQELPRSRTGGQDPHS
jgi:hypothetical protein